MPNRMILQQFISKQNLKIKTILTSKNFTMQMENICLRILLIFYTFTIFYIFKVESILMMKINFRNCSVPPLLMMNATFSSTLESSFIYYLCNPMGGWHMVFCPMYKQMF